MWVVEMSEWRWQSDTRWMLDCNDYHTNIYKLGESIACSIIYIKFCYSKNNIKSYAWMKSL